MAVRPLGEQLETLPGDEQLIENRRVQEAETKGIIIVLDTDDFFQHDAGPQSFADHEGCIIGQVVRGADVQVGEGLLANGFLLSGLSKRLHTSVTGAGISSRPRDTRR